MKENGMVNGQENSRSNAAKEWVKPVFERTPLKEALSGATSGTLDGPAYS